MSHDSSQIIHMKINNGPLGVTPQCFKIAFQSHRIRQVNDDWVFLVGASTEPDLQDLHVLDELEIAHWQEKVAVAVGIICLY